MNTKSTPVPATLAFAKKLFDRGNDTFGPEEIGRVFGLKIDNVPPIPFSEWELIRARELGQSLILQVNKTKEGTPLTMKAMKAMFNDRLGDTNLICGGNIDIEGESFYNEFTPRLGWILVSREMIPDSAGKNYIMQTFSIRDYLTDEVYMRKKLPVEYVGAISEFAIRMDELNELCRTDWIVGVQKISELKLNTLFRQTPVEILYSLIVHHEINRDRLVRKNYLHTGQRALDGKLVCIGYFDSDGIAISRCRVYGGSKDTGVCFSRMGVEVES